MSTRSATIIRQTTYWGEEADTEELMRFYRHCDGYPEGHGMDMAEAVIEVDGMGIDTRAWCQPFLAKFLGKPCTVEFEPFGCQHGDLEYLYVVEGLVDHRWGAKHDGKLPVIISVYGIGWDENYADVEKREPIFSGTAYEYIEKFGNGESKLSITDELREESRGIQTFTCMTEQAEELLAIADRIDAEHEAACAEAYGNGVQSVALPDMTAYVKLPVDAEGVPIHVGDVMDGNRGTVTCIRDAGHGWEIVTDHMYSYNPADLHHRAPTVEDVLREILDAWGELPSNATNEAIIAEYAAKLRLAEGEDA